MLSFLVFLICLCFLLLYFAFQKLYYSIQKEIDEKNKILKSINNKLCNVNEELEQRVQERTQKLLEEIDQHKKTDAELKKALNHAEKAIFLKNAFLTNISHEIRTPLNGIIGFSGLICNTQTTSISNEIAEYSANIKESGERLLKLLNNIIDISRIDAFDYAVKCEVIDLKHLLQDISQIYQPICKSKNLEWRFEIEKQINVIADTIELEKVICLLLDNCVKYTENGFVSVSLMQNIELNQAVIDISDSGIGIDPAYLDEVFDAFRQESLGYNRSFEGAGLGLPLSYRLIKLMNGNINISSKKGAGTTISIKLPITKEDANKQELGNRDKFGQHIHLQGLKILVLEDDRINRMLLEKLLKGTGEVVLAEDGDKVLNAILAFEQTKKVFDIMLFDINIPKPWNGISLMKEIKHRWPKYQLIPFIAQTAYAMSEDKDNLLHEGFDAYISKPIDYKELYYIIHKKINLHKS